jgi:hypothetical protein
MEQFWVIVGLVGLLLVLLVIGLATGFVSFNPRKARESRARGVMTLDAALSGADRRAAIEYVLQDQDEVVFDDERGDDGGEGKEDTHLVVFTDGDQDAPD